MQHRVPAAFVVAREKALRARIERARETSQHLGQADAALGRAFATLRRVANWMNVVGGEP